MKKLLSINSKTAITILVSIVVFTHLTYIFNDFIWLDHIDIESQNAIVTPSQYVQAFVRQYSQTGFYRPVLTLFHSFDYLIYGQWPTGFHFTNLLLHTLVCILIYKLIMVLFKSTPFAAMIGALFHGIHPVNSLTVAAISYRTDEIALLFTLITVWYFIKFKETEKFKYAWISTITFFLGMGAKEITVYWVPILIIVFLFSRYRKSLYSRNNLILLSLYTLGFIFYAILRSRSLPGLWQVSHLQFNPLTSFFTAIDSIGKLVFEYLLFPFPHTISDTIVIKNSFTVFSTLGVVGLIASLYYSNKFKNHPWIPYLIALFLLSLLPASNIVPLPRYISPHYLYFTTCIVSITIGFLLNNDNNLIKRKYILFGIFTWLAVAAFNTFLEGNYYKNDYSLFSYQTKKDPDFREGHFYLADHYLSENKLDNAEKELKLSLNYKKEKVSYVDENAAKINLAGIYLFQEKPDKAEKLLKEVLESPVRKVNPYVVYNLALSLYAQKKYEPLMQLYSEKKYNQNLPVEAYLLLADAHSKTGNKDTAKEILNLYKDQIKTEKQRNLYQLILNQTN
jgi:protein O-mannosyl-transferase